MSDEYPHAEQIGMFIDLHFVMDPELTTLPGFHAAVALLVGVWRWLSGSGVPVLDDYRLAATLLASLVTPVFYRLARGVDADWALLRTAQLHFLPILFPFFFMVFTDAFALLWILLMFLGVARGWLHLAALAGIMSMLVRQNNVVWVAVAWGVAYVAEHGLTLSLARVRSFLARGFLFPVALVAFVLFVMWNGGPAVGDQQMHPGHLSLGNVYFFLFCFSVCFLPVCVGHLPEVVRRVRHQRVAWVLIPAFFALYLATFVNDHPYNQIGLNFFLRNQILVAADANLGSRVLFFLPVLLGALSLWVIPLRRGLLYLLLPVSLLFVMPSWLIEQRYYLVPYTLYLLCMERQRPFVERALLVYGVLLSGVFFAGIQQQLFFL